MGALKDAAGPDESRGRDPTRSPSGRRSLEGDRIGSAYDQFLRSWCMRTQARDIESLCLKYPSAGAVNSRYA